MRRKMNGGMSVEATAAILEWPNLLARELYSAAVRQAGSREVTLQDVLSAWPTAIENMNSRLAKQTSRTNLHRAKANDKAA